VTIANVVPPPPDTTPPSVSITSPIGGSVSGSVAVSVSATDNVGVTRVDLLANNAMIATTNVAPYKMTWSTASYPNGSVTLKAMAYDAAGNSATSASVVVNVASGGAGTTDATPPVVAISNPVNGSVVGASVSIKTSATDNSGTTHLTQRVYVDGVLKTTVLGAKVSYTWSTKKVASGVHTIRVTATDAAGNVGSAQVSVSKR